MYNNTMSSPMEVQIDSIKKDIVDQVDAAIESLTLLESGEG